MSEGKGIKIGKFTYFKSSRADKKLMTKIKDPETGKVKTIHFGNRLPPANQHYKDKTGIWSHLDHNDKTRREAYLARAKGIKDKDGNPTWKDYMSPNYHSIKILWP